MTHNQKTEVVNALVDFVIRVSKDGSASESKALPEVVALLLHDHIWKLPTPDKPKDITIQLQNSLNAFLDNRQAATSVEQAVAQALFSSIESRLDYAKAGC